MKKYSAWKAQRFKSKAALAIFGFLLVPALPGLLQADTITVDATDNIYAAGQASTGSVGGGSLPDGIALPSGATYLEFKVTGSYTFPNFGCGSATTGCITVNNGGNYNDADGNFAAVSSSTNTGAGSLSGIDYPGAGELVGVFVGSGGPVGAAPPALDYRSGGNAVTTAASYSPLLDQVFYIGVGSLGEYTTDCFVDETCTPQQFHIPAGATELYLGISDASGYNGPPSAYGDNSGSYSVQYKFPGVTAPSAVPEPASFGLLVCGLSLGVLRLRRKAKPGTPCTAV